MRLNAPEKFCVVVALGLSLGLILRAQSKSSPAGKSAASSPAQPKKSWRIAHTPNGQPDIQGIWLNFDATPFERPDPSDPSEKPAPPTTALSSSGQPIPTLSLSFDDSVKRESKRPSMVVDPPNGRVPLTKWAEETRDYSLAHVHDSWIYNTPWERCITRGVPGGIFPVIYDNAYQIFQIPGYVVILYDMIHDARIIPIDGRPHLPSNVTQWNGDPRGHWEDNTLVVETTNFNGKGMMASAQLNGRIRSIPESEQTRIVERFTRVDDKTIDYEVTVTDPKAYTAPWKVAMPLVLDNTYKMYEYACHEGNRNYMEITLGAGRAQDRAVEEKTSDKK